MQRHQVDMVHGTTVLQGQGHWVLNHSYILLAGIPGKNTQDGTHIE